MHIQIQIQLMIEVRMEMKTVIKNEGGDEDCGGHECMHTMGM